MNKQANSVMRRAILLLFLLGSAPLAQSQVLNVYIGQGQMPFADGTSARPGIFAELMQVLCVRAGFDCRMRKVPWRRVLSEAQDDPQAVVLNMGRIAEREHAFLWLLNVLPTAYVLASTQQAYDTLEQAVDIANDTEYGLSAVISGDPAKAAAVAPKLRAGMVAVNAWGPGPGAAFGGYKASGNGREGGVFGLKDFMEVKSISGIPG